MALRRGSRTPRSEAGFALIEVVVSALILVMTTGGVIKLLTATGRNGTEERHKTQAYAVAQEDQTRMRALRIPTLLATAKGTSRQVTVGGTVYTVTSTAAFINATSENTGCGVGTSSDDYIKVSSEVTWPTRGSFPPIKLQSIINPPGGSLDPGKGTLVINTTKANGEPLSGVGVSGTGAGTFSGSTSSQGCIRFTDLTAGKYTLTTSKSGGYIDENGNAPGPRAISVVGASSNTISIMYDTAGSFEGTFLVRTSAANSTMKAAKAEGMVLINNGMQAQQKLAVGTSLVEKLKATNLFPFTSAYAVYASGCTREVGPAEGDATIVAATVTPGGAIKGNVPLPALFLTVKKKTISSPYSATVTGAKVRIDDTDPDCAGSLIRNTTTISGGGLSEAGLPWGNYSVCASSSVTYQYDYYNSNQRKWEVKEKTGTFREYKTLDVKSITGTSTEMLISEDDDEGACY